MKFLGTVAVGISAVAISCSDGTLGDSSAAVSTTVDESHSSRGTGEITHSAIVIGIDVTASCESLRKRAFIEAKRIVSGLKPGDFLHIRLVTEKSQLSSNSILTCTFPEVETNVNMFDVAAKRRSVLAQRRFSVMRGQVISILDTLMAGPAPHTDLVGFVSAAASVLQPAAGNRHKEVHVISDFEENVGFSATVDLSGVSVVLHENTLTENPAVSRAWSERFKGFVQAGKASSVTILTVQ